MGKSNELEASGHTSQYRSHAARSPPPYRSLTYTLGSTRRFFLSLLLPEQVLVLGARHLERASEAHHSKARDGAAGVLQKNPMLHDTESHSPDPNRSQFGLNMELSSPHRESLASPQFRVQKRARAATNPLVVSLKSPPARPPILPEV